MAIFRSQLQGELLARLLLNPSRTSLSDLARDLDAPFATVRREAKRLVKAGLLRDQVSGRSRLLEVNTDHVAYRPLRDLVLVTFGPRQVIEEEFAELPGTDGLYIYGSWAARYLGEEGPEPHDIDVLLVGTVDRDVAYEAADRAQKRLQREVNPTVVSLSRWEEGTEPFLVQLRQRPLVTITPVGTTVHATGSDIAGHAADQSRGEAGDS